VEYRERAPTAALPLKERRNFHEVSLGLREEDVIREAERCLQCGGCSECLECIKACEAKAIDHWMKDEQLEIEVGSIILSPGFDEFEPSLKSEYGYGDFLMWFRVSNSSDSSLPQVLSRPGPQSF